MIITIITGVVTIIELGENLSRNNEILTTFTSPIERPPPLVLPNGLDPNAVPLPLRLLPQISTIKSETNSSTSKSINNNFSSASSTTSSVSSDQGDNSLARKKSLTCKKSEVPHKLHGLDHGHSSSNSHHHHSHNSQRPYPIIPHASPQHQQVQQPYQQQASTSSLAGFEFRPRADSNISDAPFITRSNSTSSSSNLAGPKGGVRFNDFYSPPFSNTSSNSESPAGGLSQGNGNGMEFDFNNELDLNSPIIPVPLSSSSSTHPSNLIHHQHQNTIVDWNSLLQQGQPSSNQNNNNNTFSSNQMAYNAQSNPAPPSSSSGYPYGVQNSAAYASWPVYSQSQQPQQQSQPQQQFYQQQQQNQNQYQQQQQVPLTHSSLAHLVYPLPQPLNYLEHPPTPPSSIHFDFDLDESDYELQPSSERNEFIYGNNVSHPLDREESLEEFLAALGKVEEEGGRRDYSNISVGGGVGSSVAGSEFRTKAEEEMNDWELVGTNTGSVAGEEVSYDYSSSIYNPAVQQPQDTSVQSRSQTQYEQYEQQQKLQLHQRTQQQLQIQQPNSEQDWRSVNYDTNSNSSVAASLDGQDHQDQHEFEYETSHSNSISLYPNHHQQQRNSGSNANSHDDERVKEEDYDDEENNEFMSRTLHNNHPFLGVNGPGGRGSGNDAVSSAVEGGEMFDINRWRSDLEVHFDDRQPQQNQNQNHLNNQQSNVLTQPHYRLSPALGSGGSGGGSTGGHQEIFWSNPNLNSSQSNFDLLPPSRQPTLPTRNNLEYSINNSSIKLEPSTDMNQRAKQEDSQFINGHFNLSLESNSHSHTTTASSTIPDHLRSSPHPSTRPAQLIKEEDWLREREEESRRLAVTQRVQYSNSLEIHHHQQQQQRLQNQAKKEDEDQEDDGYGNEDPTTPHFSMISRVKFEDDEEGNGPLNVRLDDDDIIKKEYGVVGPPEEWGT